MGAVPLLHGAGEAGVEHVAVYVAAALRLQGKHLAAQQRRHDGYAPGLVAAHGAERQGKPLCGPKARDAGEEPEHGEAGAPGLGQGEAAVEEEVLVAYAHLRHGGAEEEVGYAREQLVEVHHEVYVACPDALVEHTHAAHELRHAQHIIYNAAPNVEPLVGRGRQEVGAVEKPHRGLCRPREESGQLPRPALAHEHLHHLVAGGTQHRLHGEGLREMAPAFPLHNE